MFGFSPFSSLPFSTIGGSTPVPPIVYEIDMHDGGKRKKQETEFRKKEAEKAKLRRDEVLALFEQIKPFVIEATAKSPAIINYDAMLADLDRVNRIYNEYIEMDDEEVLALL